ncbi:TatD family hydrolase [Desulfuromonas versatilis]|uniref:TatD family hydrolase n=1 Tax=Desulfuromonas versatilis TaxID=2802975 RepID=A0ABN6DSX1_9BACT|nr:TatD family hydrolase [Desulfuromonas versatilis]BCR03273.1 TatD family hydrolase [Desulfuromonas versatilis]
MSGIKTGLFDTHVHLDCAPLKQNVEQEVRHARQVGVENFLVPGVRRSDWPSLLALVEGLPGALAAPGLHPLAADQWGAGAAAELALCLQHSRIAAVGEVGLDGLLEAPGVDVQERAFRAQLRLAVAADLPVLIHCRRSIGRLLSILREEGAQRVGGIFHSFSGSSESARAAIELGFAIGFGGPLTFPDARRAPEVLRALPAEWIVLETDAPDLTPHPFRGQVNRPAYLGLIAERVAGLRGWTLQETARITTANARRVLRLKESGVRSQESE